ncbi:MAG: DUF4922 domain-containing protein [bacterium]
MVESLLLNETELQLNGSSVSIANKMQLLLQQQFATWELLNKNYTDLDTVKIKTFNFEKFKINVQFNPSRITSSAAKVDSASIKARKSFLHYNNLPESQKGILYKEDYLILCNPYPIFNQHFTIPIIEQTPQTIIGKFGDFLHLTKDISEKFVVFYNGPKCGASAPDHMHFQAGNKNFMPLDYEYDTVIKHYGKVEFSAKDISVYSVDNYLRRFISIQSTDINTAEKYFYQIINKINKTEPTEIEPMLNIIGYYRKDEWVIVIFPRQKHRPTYYFEEGENNILLSPASVDMGGVFITPLEKDFDKITKEQIIDIFDQVTINKTAFSNICSEINKFD